MSIKPARSASPRTLLSIADNDALTIPNGDCLIGTTVTMDGNLATGTASQYLLSKGEYQTTQNFQLFLNGTTGTNPGKFQSYLNGNGAAGLMSAVAVEAGKSYFIGDIRLNNVFYSVICPVLQQEPLDDSAVLFGASNSTGSRSVTNELNSASDFNIFGRTATDRQFDHSTSRIFIAAGTFTKLQIAQLAFGREITDFVVPQFYLRLDGPSDIKDYGPSALPVNVSGTFLQGTDPGFGYVAAQVAPAITGKPSINGSVQVGVAASYAAAAMTGSPKPVASQEWSVDGVVVSTSPTYTPSTSDSGKSLRVTQIADNGVNPVARSQSDAVVVTNGTTGLTFTAPAAERIYQRDQSGGAGVDFSGTWTGPTKPTRIEFEIYASHNGSIQTTWANANATIGDGVWSATPRVQAPTNGKKYRARVRSLDSAGNVLVTTDINASRFGVGDIIPFVGSSSPVAWIGSNGGTGSGYAPDHDAISTINGESTSPSWALWGTSGAAIDMANYWSAQFGVPICVFGAANGGDSLTNWQSTTTGSFPAFARYIAFVGGKLGGVVASMGSNDAASATLVTSRAQHLGKIRTFIANTRATTGQPNLPFLWAGYNRRTDGRNPQSDYVRMAENDVGDDANVWHVQSLDYPLVDNAHMTTAAAKSYCLNRLMPVYAQAFLGTYLRGPKIVNMQKVSSGVVDVTVQHRGSTDLVPNSTITGYKAYDASNLELADVAATITASNKMRVTSSGTISRLTYLEGNAPDVGTPVYGNSNPQLPMTVETDMALTDSGVVTPPADTTIPVMQGEITFTNVTDKSVLITWPNAIDNVGVVSYEISLNNGATYLDVSSARSYQASNLVASSTYQVRVRATDAAGNRAVPLMKEFTTTAGTVTPPIQTTFMRSKQRTIIIKAAPGKFAQEGDFWKLDGARKPLGSIDPNSTIDITFNWTEVLADIQDTITNVQFDIIGLTNKGSSTQGAFATIFVSNATANPSITCRITTASTPPRVEDRTVYLTVEQQ